jgi:hypothetical protein
VARGVPPEGASYQRIVPAAVALNVTAPGPQLVSASATGAAAGCTTTSTGGVVWVPQVVTAVQVTVSVASTVMVGVVSPVDQA